MLNWHLSGHGMSTNLANCNLVIFYVGQQFELANCVMVTKTETVKNVKQIVPMKTEIKYKGLMKNLNKN